MSLYLYIKHSQLKANESKSSDIRDHADTACSYVGTTHALSSGEETYLYFSKHKKKSSLEYICALVTGMLQKWAVAASNFSFDVILLRQTSVPVECPSFPNRAHSWFNVNTQVVSRYFCSFFCWLFPGASTGLLSWLEGTLQALYKMRKRTRRRTATSTLHTIATTAAVDSPTPLSLDSMLKVIATV